MQKETKSAQTPDIVTEPAPEPTVPSEAAEASSPVEETTEAIERVESGEDGAPGEPLEKALKDTKSWATKVSQDNAALRAALEAAIASQPPALLSDPTVGARLARAKEVAAETESLAPVVDLLETLVRGVGNYERQVAQKALTLAVLTEHPDALELRGDESFHQWVLTQPPVVQGCLIDSPNPEDVSWAITLYKEEQKRRRSDEALRDARANRFHRLAHAASPTPQAGGAPVGTRWTREQIGRMSLEEYRKHEPEIEAALTRGEIG